MSRPRNAVGAPIDEILCLANGRRSTESFPRALRPCLGREYKTVVSVLYSLQQAMAEGCEEGNDVGTIFVRNSRPVRSS